MPKALPVVAALVTATATSAAVRAAPPAARPAAAAAPPAAASPDPYPSQLQAALTAAIAPFVKAERKRLAQALRGQNAPQLVVIEARIEGNGRIVRSELARPGVPAIDTAALLLVHGAEPLPAPPTAPRDCLLRVALVAGKAPQLTCDVACWAQGATAAPATVADTALAAPAADAGAQLMLGYRAEAAGQGEVALAHYRAAVAAASDWLLASRALGLLLWRARQYDEAAPLLERYLQSQRPSPEAAQLDVALQRLAAQRAAAERPRDRLAPDDIGRGLQEGYPSLEPCLAKARQERRLAVGSDTLLLTFTIEKNGSISRPALDGPDALLATPHATCIEQAMLGFRFPPYTEGSEVTVRRVPLNVRGREPEPERPVAAASAELASGQATITQCSRDGSQIAAYLRGRAAAVNRCVNEERRRNPKAAMPSQVTVSLVVAASGEVQEVLVDHRYYREGPMARCVATALAGRLEASDGAACPTQFGLALGGGTP